METLARNVVHFVRLLRGAGLGMSPAQAVDALEALRWIDIERRDDLIARLGMRGLRGAATGGSGLNRG